MSNSHLPSLSSSEISTVLGGADTAQQAQLRSLAKSYCPQTYAANQNRPITRPLAERCLVEAGLSSYSGMLDRYFPKQ